MFDYHHPGVLNPVDPATEHDKVVEQGQELGEAFRASLDGDNDVV